MAFASAVLSETAGAGNGLNRESQHRRVKTGATPHPPPRAGEDRVGALRF